VVLEVEVIPAGHTLASGHFLEQGKHRVTVYESDVPRIRAEVEDNPEGLQAAERRFEALLRQELEEQRTAPTPEAIAALRRTHPGSVSAAFHELYFRSPRPLRSAREVERLPSPKVERMQHDAAVMSEVVATVAAEVVGKQQQQQQHHHPHQKR
jgi:hypothetical protein